MKKVLRVSRVLKELDRFRPDFEEIPRHLAVYSASIALADEDILKKSALLAQNAGVDIAEIYEVMLQSYLFLGFPRMLNAAECFIESFPDFTVHLKVRKFGSGQLEKWQRSGTSLCQKVYAGNFTKLKRRISQFSPDIFNWMILEGYGKVLSRPGLDIRRRELAVVACLMIDKCPKQLFSHIRGALNVGVAGPFIKATIDDVSSIFKCENGPALSFLKRLGSNV